MRAITRSVRCLVPVVLITSLVLSPWADGIEPEIGLGSTFDTDPMVAGSAADEGLQVAMGDAGLWQAASADELDGMRGAFDFSSGLRVSLGVDRAVYMNGALVTHTDSQIGDAAGVLSSEALQAGSLALVRQGAGNVSQLAQLAAGSQATLVQNTLNGQNIAVITTINVAANSMQMIRSLNLQGAMQDALTLPLSGLR